MRYAWPNASARPFESLLILVLRFLWLNRPSPKEFSMSAGLTLYECLNLNLTTGRIHSRAIELSKFCQLVSVSESTLAVSTLVPFAASAIYDSFRYCPQCLQSGYHTAIFQLHSLELCPEHYCSLVQGCSQCGAGIPCTLEARHFSHPLMCLNCAKQLVLETTLIDPPSRLHNDHIREIFDWYWEVDRIPKVVSSDWLQWGREVSVGAPFIELMIKRKAPSNLKLERSGFKAMEVRSALCGIPAREEDRKLRKPGLDRLEGRNEEKDIETYKWFRRHLWRSLRRPRYFVPLFMQIHERPWDRARARRFFELSEDEKIQTFAFMMFVFSIEGLEGLNCRKIRLEKIQGAFDFLFSSKGSDCIVPRCLQSFRCSDAERDWIRTHFVVDGLRGLFNEALVRAREMVRSGYYFLLDLSRVPGTTCPLAIAILNRNGAAEYWSLTMPVDRQRYTADQVSFIGPPSLKIFYKASDAEELLARPKTL